MVLKISKYSHIDNIPKISLTFQNYRRYSKNTLFLVKICDKVINCLKISCHYTVITVP